MTRTCKLLFLTSSLYVFVFVLMFSAMVCRFNDLVRRFERPDGKNRWDSRLFELHPAKGRSWTIRIIDEYAVFWPGMLLSHLLRVRTEDIHEGSQAIVEAVNFLTGDTKSAGARNSQMLQPTIATQNVRSQTYPMLPSMVVLYTH